MNKPADSLLWARRAWLPGGWQDKVLLRIGADGRWAEIVPGVLTPPQGAEQLGTVLPGLVDAHSHAFQRAFAGLAEQRTSAADTFWSWRDRMYRVALRITPEQLRAIAAQLYIELLQGGYTQVCEFHYLQHAPDGQPYADPLAFSWALADAARDVGIGLTLLPVLYERAGFQQPALRPDQRRFATSAESVWQAVQTIRGRRQPGLDAGIAIHSLRAASPASVQALVQGADGFDGPIHIHVAEQTAEVDDCLAATGQRPIAWLAAQGLLDVRWQLVHATHTVPQEIDAVARSGAGIVLCPTTEANLGDGLPDLPGILAQGVPITLGSDSQINRDWRDEVRWLEYGQRLIQRQRNTAAAPEAAQPSTAARLWSSVQAGSAHAAGQPAWGLTPGARADALVLNPHAAATLGMPPSHLLDALVFSSPFTAWKAVMVAGRWVLHDGQHPQAAQCAQAFERAMQALWAEG
jgi:formimidoylglutamate deiminase